MDEVTLILVNQQLVVLRRKAKEDTGVSFSCLTHKINLVN